MVFCKLSKKLKNRLESAEDTITNSATITKDVINTHINNNLNAIANNKKSISSKIQAKIDEKKKYINENIIKPHQEKKRNNAAMMFFVDVSLSIVLAVFLYKMYPFLKRFMDTSNYTKEQYDNATKLPEDAYSREDLRTVQEFRKSFIDWIDYYKTEDAFSEYNLGTPEIRKGNDLREPFKFMIQYVIPYVILAYVVWFIVKYIKYVIAAIWGFFVTVYQFVTKKITCKLGEKWYIRMATGWSSCHPDFGEYVDRWKNQYVVRPVAEERITYLKGLERVKSAYGNQTPYKIGMDFWFNWLNMFWDWLYNLKRIYFDLPLEELYLQLIKFHPTYVVRPYEIISKEKKKIGKTKKGKVCKCPPKKTVMDKLKKYVSDSKCKAKLTKCKINKIIKSTNSTIESTKEVSHNTINKASKYTSNINKKVSKVISNATDCNNYDKIIENKKKVAQGIWTTLMILTTCVIVYSVIYGYDIFEPVYKFTNNYNYKIVLANKTKYILIMYFSIFFSLGYYSFLH
jgi:hypothetical protein